MAKLSEIKKWIRTWKNWTLLIASFGPNFRFVDSTDRFS
jgi:hypothetical protein